MRYQSLTRLSLVIVAGLLAARCTTKEQETPPLSGPSEYGTSISVSVSPDIISQDGSSQSMITVTARDVNGQPLRNLSLRTEIEVGGVLADFGSLSARSLVTGSDGRASAVYTAPPSTRSPVDNGTIVTIVVTPIGSDFGNASSRSASIRLVPPGVVVPPDGLKPSFTFSPSLPTDSQPVLFDASASTSAAGNPIVGYSWNFGDGRVGSGVTTSHAYATAGTYIVQLTISDAYGRTAQASSSVTVGAAVNPTAAFSISPADPLVNQPVNFNAAASRAAPGRTITKYEWDFGDGTFGTGQITSHVYSLPRAYVVILTVTDDTGKKGTVTGNISPK
jgi:chitodextrinase